jgi:hypothetical protein
MRSTVHLQVDLKSRGPARGCECETLDVCGLFDAAAGAPLQVRRPESLG